MLLSEFGIKSRRTKVQKTPPARRTRGYGTPAAKPVPTPFAQDMSLAKDDSNDKSGGDSLEVASISDVATAAADAPSCPADPL